MKKNDLIQPITITNSTKTLWEVINTNYGVKTVIFADPTFLESIGKVFELFNEDCNIFDTIEKEDIENWNKGLLSNYIIIKLSKDMYIPEKLICVKCIGVLSAKQNAFDNEYFSRCSQKVQESVITL